MKSVWQRTIKYTFATTLVAALISCFLYILIHPSTVQVNLDAANPKSTSSLGYLGYLSNMIPTNLLSPFLEQQVMGVLLLSIVIGFAVRQIPRQSHVKLLFDFSAALMGCF